MSTRCNFFVNTLKPAETYTHTHTHTHTCNLLLSIKQIGTICFANFFRVFATPIFALIFTFGDITSAMAVSCDSVEDGSVVYYNGNSYEGPFSVSFSYGSVNGIGICSIDAGSSYGELGSPDTVSGSGRNRKNCWCQITDIDGTSNSSPNAVFLESYATVGVCRNSCAEECANVLAGDRGIRATLYSDPDASDMCEGQPWGGPCNTEISLVTLDPDICEEWTENESVDGQNWTVTLMPGGNETLSGVGGCFDVAGNYRGEVSQTQPSSGTGSDCWCGIGMYNDGNTTYLSGMISWFYFGDNWGDPSSCEADCPWACVEIMQQGLCNFVENADELSMCIYEEPSAYSVSYDCGYNGSGSPSDPSSYSSGDTVYTQSSSACTPSPGYEFSYWDCNTGTNITPGDSFTIYDNTTCTANYDYYGVGGGDFYVQYSCGMGSGSPSDSSSYSSGDTVYTQSSSDCTPPTGHQFAYWDCDGMIVDAEQDFTIYDNTTCAAQYTAIKYNVSYSCGVATAGSAPLTTVVSYGASFAPAANTCGIPGGYSGFVGWAVSGTNDVKPAATAFNWNYTEGKTLTAQFTPNTISLSWDGGGAPQSCSYGDTFNVPTPPSRTGHVFVGWKVNSNP